MIVKPINKPGEIDVFMKMDSKLIKLLSSETRITIIKLLEERRHMPSELARKLGKSPSTIVEHLRKLEEYGLVRRICSKNKWVYYELTPEGKKLVDKKDMRIVIPLALGTLFLIISVFLIPITREKYVEAEKPAQIVYKSLETRVPVGVEVVEEPSFDINLLLILVGLFLVLYSIKRIATR